MKRKATTPTERTFAQTTVNQDAIWEYLHSDPGYLASSVECEEDDHLNRVSNLADYFEFHLRRYVAGCTPTLHRLFMEVRAFVAYDETWARDAIPILMEKSVRQAILDNEWYEWMPRYERAHQRIQQQFGI